MHRIGTRIAWKTSLIVLSHLLIIYTWWPADAQEKIAEGEYQTVELSSTASSHTKIATRWSLYAKTPGDYQLSSEIQNMPIGVRVIQREELDKDLAPSVIGYDLYLKEEKEPALTVRCHFNSDSIVCDGRIRDKQVPPSTPYRRKGRPFWLWVRDLSALDIPWLISGAVNMSHLKTGRTTVEAFTVSGGTASAVSDAVMLSRLGQVKTNNEKVTVPGVRQTTWDFESDEEDALEFVAWEATNVNGTNVAVKHYKFHSGDQNQHLWITESGMLIKLSGTEENGEFVLTNYKQYKKLIPELPIEREKDAQ